MSDPKLYPIAPQIFESRESELNSKLPELYPNESERQIAEQILVPQMRSVIAEALSNFNSTRGALASVPPPPSELPNLCVGVDRALAANRDLLDLEGLGKPLFEYVQSVRESVRAEMAEAFRVHCRMLLSAHGVIDRATLLAKGTRWFIKANFPLYGKGKAFASLILRETVKDLSIGHLRRIADTLGLPNLSDETRQKFLDALATHGVTDRATFLHFGIPEFSRADFPPYGKGMAFAGMVLGEAVGSNLYISHLRRIADILGWLKPNEKEEFQAYRNTLAVHGITDRNSLLAKGSEWFKKADFPPYGKGRAFAGLVLGELIQKGVGFSLAHLRRIADILFPESK